MVSFGASYHRAAGLRVALRPKRVLSWHHPITAIIRDPSENFNDAIKNGIVRLYPDDELELGDSIIEVGYNQQAFKIVIN